MSFIVLIELAPSSGDNVIGGNLVARLSLDGFMQIVQVWTWVLGTVSYPVDARLQPPTKASRVRTAEILIDS